MAMTKLTNSPDPGTNRFLLKKAALKNAELLISAVANYSMVHQNLFGKYEGELMHPPEPYLLYHNLSGTFNDFLERENLTILTPFFELLHTGHGYGYLDEVGAIYGLMRNTPELVISAALRLLEADEDPYSFYAFKEGFEKIWTTIVEKEELDIVYNSNIVNIARSPLGTYIHHTMGDGLYIEKDWCDFLIWTPPMTEMLKKLSTAATHEEHHYFGHLYPEIYSVSLMSATSPFKGENEAYTYYRENIANKTNHGVLCDLSISNVDLSKDSNRVKRSWDNFAKLRNRGGKRQGKKQRDNKSSKKKNSDKNKSKNIGKWESNSNNIRNDRKKSGSKRNGRNRNQNTKQNQLQNGFGRVNSIQDIIDQAEWSPPQKSRDTKPRKGKNEQFRQKNRGQSPTSAIRRPSTPNRSQTRNGRKNSFGRNTRPRQGRQNQGGGGGGKGGQEFKIVYQIGKNYTSESHLNNLAKNYFVEGFEYEDVELFNTISWPYFHRWTAHEVMKGNHWDVFSLQGVYRTWYAGASVSFESVKSVMEYNNLLLRQMTDPYEKLPIKHGDHPVPHLLPYADHSHPGHPKHPLHAEYHLEEHHAKIHHPVDHHLVEHAKHLLHADHHVQHHPVHSHHPAPVDHGLSHHPHHPQPSIGPHIEHLVHPHTPAPVDHVLPHPHHPHHPHPSIGPHVGHLVHPHTPAPVDHVIHQHHHAHHPHPAPSIGPQLPQRHPHHPQVPHPQYPHPTVHQLPHHPDPRPTPYESHHNYYPHQLG